MPLVTIITIENVEDIALLIKGSWPHLSMVILPKQRHVYIPRPSIEVIRHRWQLLACVSLGEDGFGNKDVALLLQSLQQPQYTTSDSTELAVKPVEHLLSSKWSGSGSASVSMGLSRL